jgi:hypothetical protein
MRQFKNVEIFHAVHVAPLLCTSTYHEHVGPGAAEPQPKEKAGFTAEAQSSPSFRVFLIKNSLLRTLRASAVSSLLDRDNQNSHWEICANSENSQA